MAIVFPNGFNITVQEPIDTRLLLSKAEMLAMKKARMPERYFALCKDDGKIYLYNSENDLDSVLGRFRLYTADISKESAASLIDPDTENTLQMTDNGLMVKGNKAISSSTIENLFAE